MPRPAPLTWAVKGVRPFVDNSHTFLGGETPVRGPPSGGMPLPLVAHPGVFLVKTTSTLHFVFLVLDSIHIIQVTVTVVNIF